MTQIKSRQRVADHGEVFTRPQEVNAMIDMVIRAKGLPLVNKHGEAEMPDESTVLEPACGDGNFLIEILKRKLSYVANQNKRKPRIHYDYRLIVALSSLYGIDLLQDNVLRCRERLLNFAESEYQRLFECEMSAQLKNVVEYILKLNILHGDALKMVYADSLNQPIDEHFLHFSQWAAVSFPRAFCLSRKEYQYAHLIQTESRSHYQFINAYRSTYFMDIQDAKPE
ncbi:restriction endonuclease subunit M [Lonepinella sp. MS14435]|uniref:restriction endonuclease subunit M n=1 Tax=Lonepinella sp. MS14435 TaxID=3003618 RepID=UPI0036DB3341